MRLIWLHRRRLRKVVVITVLTSSISYTFHKTTNEKKTIPQHALSAHPVHVRASKVH